MTRIQRHELEAWLGPALAELNPEQVDQLHREAERIEESYPDPDDQDLRDAALSAATQYLLGETTLTDAGRALDQARMQQARAMVVCRQLALMAVADGMPDAQAAREVHVDRQTVLGWLGKRRRRAGDAAQAGTTA